MSQKLSPAQFHQARAQALQRSLQEQLGVAAGLEELLAQAEAQLLAERASLTRRIADLEAELKQARADLVEASDARGMRLAAELTREQTQ